MVVYSFYVFDRHGRFLVMSLFLGSISDEAANTPPQPNVSTKNDGHLDQSLPQKHLRPTASRIHSHNLRVSALRMMRNWFSAQYSR